MLKTVTLLCICPVPKKDSSKKFALLLEFTSLCITAQLHYVVFLFISVYWIYLGNYQSFMKSLKKLQTLWSLFRERVQLPQGCRATRENRLILTTKYARVPDTHSWSTSKGLSWLQSYLMALNLGPLDW